MRRAIGGYFGLMGTPILFGAAVGMVYSVGSNMLFGLFGVWHVLSTVAIELAGMSWFAYHKVRKVQRQIETLQAQLPRTITPAMVDHPDEMMRHVIAQSWNTNRAHRGRVDVDGKMHIEEIPAIRIPVTVTDKHGNVTDGTAEVVYTFAGGQMSDVRDLDGNELGIPPNGGVLEASIDPIPPPP